VSTNFERSPDATGVLTLPDTGDLSSSSATEPETTRLAAESVITLASLPLGARLILRCRKDWRAASVSAIEADCVRLNVASPTGHTYRVRRPHDSLLTFDGSIPLLGEGARNSWRVALARYDVRW
jgi:hypothetical protein